MNTYLSLIVACYNEGEHLEKSFDRVIANLPVKTAEILPEQDIERERVKEALLKITDQEVISEKESPQPTSEVPNYFAEEAIEPDIQKKVEVLIGVAMEQGIPMALKLAKKQDVFIQDALHDALIDRLLPELKKRGHL